MRTSTITRKTNETDISLSLCIDGTGKSEVSTGCGFLDHMLSLFASHGNFDVCVECKGDVQVDYHHTVEDIGIVLGSAFKEALGNCAGIKRYGNMILPMDESLVMCAVDVSGRSYLGYCLPIPTQKVGDFDTELVNEFFAAFIRSSAVTLHIKLLDGSNSHHIIEASFKAFARALKEAVEKIGDDIPSTKGII